MEFEERVIKIRELGSKSSSDLYAGMPMIYKCKICNGIADTRPESYDPRDYPKTEQHCTCCKKELKKRSEEELLKIVHSKKVQNTKVKITKKYDDEEEACRDWLHNMKKLSGI